MYAFSEKDRTGTLFQEKTEPIDKSNDRHRQTSLVAPPTSTDLASFSPRKGRTRSVCNEGVMEAHLV